MLRRLPAFLLVYAQVGYPAVLAAWAKVERPEGLDVPAAPPTADLPAVTLVIAAYNEGSVITQKVENALALDYPRERLQVIVAADGCTDDTVPRARAAGADVVLDLPRGGKVRAQDAAVREAEHDLIAFSDANALLAPDALRELVAPLVRGDGDGADRIGYVCGQVAFVNEAGTNQEGLYWRYEMAIRALESRLASVTGGNGAIYAVRREAYVEMDERMGHDLSFPFTLVKRGWRAVYRPSARATEKMVPSVEGEWRRKRRMMSHAWPIVVEGGLLDPRGYPPRYAFMVASHRALRYASPFLHLAALAWKPSRRASALLLAAALLGDRVKARPLLIARYYVLTQASIAMGLHDYARHGTPAGWTAPEGTR